MQHPTNCAITFGIAISNAKWKTLLIVLSKTEANGTTSVDLNNRSQYQCFRFVFVIYSDLDPVPHALSFHCLKFLMIFKLKSAELLKNSGLERTVPVPVSLKF